jgi:hypothetical protein
VSRTRFSLVALAALGFPLAASAQSSVGSCHMQVDGSGLFQASVINVKMAITAGANDADNVCPLDLKTISSGGASVQGRGSLPIQILKADLRSAPKHGSVDREGVLINYRVRRGFRGSDRFSVLLIGRHGQYAGATTVEFAVAVR